MQTETSIPEVVSPDAMTVAENFEAWLAEAGVSLAMTTYQAGLLYFIGRRQEGGLRAHQRAVTRCQGLCIDGTSLWVSSDYHLIRFENALRPGGRTPAGADRVYAPREIRITGWVDCHDVAVVRHQSGTLPVFVATAFNCLATISHRASFRPLWRPPFITRFVAEDRCHLNGLASRDGRPTFVTAVGRSDVADGWREQRRGGGVVIDAKSNEVVLDGLSMPHSPRWHDGRLWLLNSGSGEFGTVDLAAGRFEPVAFCPGYARGLAFAGRHAVIALSRPRPNRTFEGLRLDDRLREEGASARSGLIIIDTETGATVSWLVFNHSIDELYDVAVIEGVEQPEAIGFNGDDIKTHITLE